MSPIIIPLAVAIAEAIGGAGAVAGLSRLFFPGWNERRSEAAVHSDSDNVCEMTLDQYAAGGRDGVLKEFGLEADERGRISNYWNLDEKESETIYNTLIRSNCQEDAKKFKTDGGDAFILSAGDAMASVSEGCKQTALSARALFWKGEMSRLERYAQIMFDSHEVEDGPEERFAYKTKTLPSVDQMTHYQRTYYAAEKPYYFSKEPLVTLLAKWIEEDRDVLAEDEFGKNDCYRYQSKATGLMQYVRTSTYDTIQFESFAEAGVKLYNAYAHAAIRMLFEEFSKRQTEAVAEENEKSSAIVKSPDKQLLSDEDRSWNNLFERGTASGEPATSADVRLGEVPAEESLRGQATTFGSTTGETLEACSPGEVPAEEPVREQNAGAQGGTELRLEFTPAPKVVAPADQPAIQEPATPAVPVPVAPKPVAKTKPKKKCTLQNMGTPGCTD